MFIILPEWSSQPGKWLPDPHRSVAYTGDFPLHSIYTVDSYSISGWEEFIAPLAFDGYFLRESLLRT